MLSITSEAGSYQALLTGFVQPPQPAGPFKCAGGKVSVPFMNPFPTATDFKFQVPLLFRIRAFDVNKFL